MVDEELPKKELELTSTPLAEKPEEQKIMESKKGGAGVGSAETASTGEAAGSLPPKQPPTAGSSEEKQEIHGTNVVSQLNEIGLETFVFAPTNAGALDEEDKKAMNDAWNALFSKYGVKEGVITNPIGLVIVANLRAVAKKRKAIMEGMKKTPEAKTETGINLGRIG